MARRNLNVLILEENPYHLELITVLIERCLKTATIDCQQRKTSYDLIFCDSVFKIALLKKVFPKTPVVVLEAHSDETKAAKAIKMGALDYFPKTRDSLETLPPFLKKWGQKTTKLV